LHPIWYAIWYHLTQIVCKLAEYHHIDPRNVKVRRPAIAQLTELLLFHLVMLCDSTDQMASPITQQGVVLLIVAMVLVAVYIGW